MPTDPLGRGLESLIPDRAPDEDPAVSDFTKDTPESERKPVSEVPKEPVLSQAVSARTYQDHFVPRRGDSVFSIEIEKIDPNPYQPRREFDEVSLAGLAESIREHGVIQPILVTKREIETPTGISVRYQLIAGERRLRAARKAGLSQIPAVIRRGVPDERIKLELALIENIQREDLNALDKARSFKRLIDEFHLMQREIAQRVGKSREMVANTLRLLALPEEIQNALLSEKISEGHARAILMAGDDIAKQMEVYHTILLNKFSVREAEAQARKVSGKEFRPRKRASKVLDPEARQWQDQLQEKLGTKVKLERLGEKGKIIVEFYSEEELRSILAKLMERA